jgi:AbiJ N-terminal domain 4
LRRFKRRARARTSGPPATIDRVPIYDTFTKRKRRAERGRQTDVYRYDVVPETLRAQVLYIWREALGGYRKMHPYEFQGPPPSNDRWQVIRDVIAKERGVLSLSGRASDNPLEQCVRSLLEGTADEALELIEVTFRAIDKGMSQMTDWERQKEGLKTSPSEAIEELNGRFREHGVGYRYEDGLLVRIDSEMLHSEVTAPALQLLHEEGFEGPLQEFMSAHEHHRKGETKDANVDALNALESTLKAICDKRKWKYSGTATATDLIRVVMDNGLIPAQLQSQFDNLIRAMKTGLPPVRHNFGGHGQGASSRTVEDHLAAYSLHLMAANIVLLIEAHRALGKI